MQINAEKSWSKNTDHHVKKKRRKFSTEFWMLIPSMVLLAIISIFPFLYLIYASFMDFTISFQRPEFIGLGNWIYVLSDSLFWSSWGRTILYVGVGLGLQLLIGVGMALAIYHLPKGKNIVVTLWMIPVFVAPVVAGLLGRYLLNSTYGLYDWFFSLLGMETQILGDTMTSMPAIILMDVWEWTPLITLIVLAGLNSLSSEPLEAADVDGANYLQKLTYVILPLIAKTIVVALLVRSMDILRFVDKIKIATEGGPADSTKVAGYYLMEVAFKFQDFGAGSVLGITMLIVTIFLGQFFVKFMMDKQ
ncbi:sugar ABC transporter permease [Gracilibacillus sp. YIM 98692]|uniref:carbohydrate ABC transporter permease n=1 Tax=Gracilibacillus sp. YIM 98692 TaxID=2663532 RepID=UPI001F093B5B|nr:sugar ABC transporter permease [Gracilibacillus sp. YIM 98692]